MLDKKDLNKIDEILCKRLLEMDNWRLKTADYIQVQLDTNRMLLCDVLEALGLNPIECSLALREFLVYFHGSLKSSMPGWYIEEGILYDGEGNVLPMDTMYEAREKGISFMEAARLSEREGEEENKKNASLSESENK